MERTSHRRLSTSTARQARPPDSRLNAAKSAAPLKRIVGLTVENEEIDRNEGCTYSIRIDDVRRCAMQKKLTITIDEKVYEGLHDVIGPRKISKFVEELVRPHVVRPRLESEYEKMAQDKGREAEALEWAEATFGDSALEAR